MRLFKLSFLVCFLSLYVASNAQESYLIELTGEDAKKVKEMIQKQTKDEKVKVNVYDQTKKDDVGDSRFLGIGINKNISYSASQGEKIYNAKCKSCHGENGSKRAYGKSRPLTELTADAIVAAISGYTNDPNFGNSTRKIMQPMASRISSADLGYIIAYLKGEDSFIFEKEDIQKQNADVQTTPTEQGVYIK